MKIYFVGIKGVGMTGLAIIAAQAGFLVSGSDVAEEFITDKILKKEKISFIEGFDEENIKEFASNTLKKDILVVTSAANGGFDNIECVWAVKNGIKVISHGQAVGQFMQGDIFARKFKTISVSGSHGKTTITAFIATVLTKLDFNPSYSVGTSEIFPLGSSGHYGKGDYFVAEADEYLSEIKHDRKAKFLYQSPDFLIINNIDFDHPDFYKDIREIEVAYLALTKRVKEGGVIIANGDDKRVKNTVLKSGKKAIFYGEDKSNGLVISDFSYNSLGSKFNVLFKKTSTFEFEISIPGFHNAKNALAVIALLGEIGIPLDKIKQVLPEFLGTKRRLETVGVTKKGMEIIDDYAHHPEEIKKSLTAVKEAFPSKKIALVFQPHTYSRTESLLNEFVSSFARADDLILIPTFASKREGTNLQLDRNLLLEFKKIRKNVLYIKNLSDVVEYVDKNYNNESFILLTMGAGDVYKIGYTLVKNDR